MKRDTSRLAGALLASCALALSACVSLASVEPIKAPPSGYHKDVVVHTEFLQPARVGRRCAERGASIFGIAVPGAMACANPTLMTVPNACDMVTGGWYAEAICAAVAHSHGWVPERREPEGLLLQAAWAPDGAAGEGLRPQGAFRAGTAIRVEFTDPARVGLRCAHRGALDAGRPTLSSVACSNASGITVVNPCSVVDGGWYADLLCHEMGHVNGWPANHPGGSFLKDGRVPGSHTLPVDQDSLLVNIRIAVETSIANQRRKEPVYAITPASLAGSPELARQIAEKAGISPMPLPELPRIDQVPDFRLAGSALPVQIAAIITARDPGRPAAAFPGPARAALFAGAVPVFPEAGLAALRLRNSGSGVPAPAFLTAPVSWNMSGNMSGNLSGEMSGDTPAAPVPAAPPALAAAPEPDAAAYPDGSGARLARVHPWLLTGSVKLLVPLD